MADIYDEDVDFNFVKIYLLSHFADHIQRFGNIQMYSTESGETSHKAMIKEGYRRSNKNDASYQILRTYARLDGFKIHEMNVNADVNHPIYDEPRGQKHRRRIGSRMRRPKGLALMIGSVAEFDQNLSYLPRLMIDYYRRKLPQNDAINEDSIRNFPIEIHRLLRVPVEDFQDPTEVTWHLLRCTGKRLWKSTGSSRNDWVWVDSRNENIYGALRGFYPARLVSIFEVRDLVKGSVDRLVLVDRLYVENSGKVSDVTGLVTVTLGPAQRLQGTTQIVVGINRIIGMAHLVPEISGTENTRWYVNNMIDLEIFNRIY